MWELSENPKQQPKMLTHFWSSSSPLDVPFPTPYYLPTVLDPRLKAGRPTSPTPLSPICLTLRSVIWMSDSLLQNLTPNWPTPFVPCFFFFRSRRFSRRHGTLCGLRAKIDKGAPLDTVTQVKNAEGKIPSLNTYPRTLTETHTHMSIYINALYRAILLVTWNYKSAKK